MFEKLGEIIIDFRTLIRWIQKNIFINFESWETVTRKMEFRNYKFISND
jgi:hypothetical protein